MKKVGEAAAGPATEGLPKQACSRPTTSCDDVLVLDGCIGSGSAEAVEGSRQNNGTFNQAFVDDLELSE